MKTLSVKTNRRTQFVDITREVEQAVRESGVKMKHNANRAAIDAWRD